VGYNSKSFDLPLLRTRFVQNRVRFQGDSVPHLDLVHAARRFWKRRLQDCSLGNIEREVLGVERIGDVPSHLIPQMWFDYLRSEDARPMRKVFYHHKMDILSLVALTGWLSQCLSAAPGAGFEHNEDRLSVVRIHYRRKAYDAVIEHGWRFIESDERSPLRRECLEMIGMALKRRQRFEEMQQAFDLLLSEFPSDFNARLELAKLHEHRTRDLEQAARLCEEGIAIIEASPQGRYESTAALSGATVLQERLARLKKKLSKGRGGDLMEEI
ncbi:MAG: ribonuclease H-like domain-containing protein, partial [Myxococcales bacterium]|nr:ribonuclease H-like domain-containing protein [Myxococcales bacterium]